MTDPKNTPLPPTPMSPTLNRRILIIDHCEQARHNLRRILTTHDHPVNALGSSPSSLPNSADHPQHTRVPFEIDIARDGRQALELIRTAQQNKRPYALAFIDKQRSPSCDAADTIECIRQLDPAIQIIVGTDHTDVAWSDIQLRLGNTENLLILRKPFDPIEVYQLACKLTKKWDVTRRADINRAQLEQLAATQNAQLKKAYAELENTNQSLRVALESKHRLEQQLRHDALHDQLTTLPNRTLLIDRLERCIERSKRYPEFQYAVMFIDLDDFKAVNDSLGHSSGDKLLIHISRLIRNNLRVLDSAVRPDADTTARLGGDEFVVLLDGIRCGDSVDQVAQRIVNALAKPVTIDGRIVHVSASIGIALSHPHYEQPDEILRDADTAMYHAKQLGKSQWAVFNPDMHEAVLSRIKMQTDLAQAVQRNELALQYQPVVCLESGRIVSFEALLRWNHPQHGPVMPTDFIAIAEESGAIVELGHWVFSEACKQLRAWRTEFPDYHNLALNINVSPRQLAQDTLIEQIQTAATESDIELSSIRIEITESAIIDHFEQADATIKQLRALGIAIHLDDFGTGYSSMSLLNNLCFDALKIDRSFLKDVTTSRRHGASIQAIIQLAHIHGCEVVAEGVENTQAMVQLQTLDCDYAQGYFFSRPLDPLTASKLLATDARWTDRAA